MENAIAPWVGEDLIAQPRSVPENAMGEELAFQEKDVCVMKVLLVPTACCTAVA